MVNVFDAATYTTVLLALLSAVSLLALGLLPMHVCMTMYHGRQQWAVHCCVCMPAEHGAW